MLEDIGLIVLAFGLGSRCLGVERVERVREVEAFGGLESHRQRRGCNRMSYIGKIKSARMFFLKGLRSMCGSYLPAFLVATRRWSTVILNDTGFVDPAFPVSTADPWNDQLDIH